MSVSVAIKQAALNAIYYMELNGHSAYVPTFALPTSTLSYGYMQNDIGTNQEAYDALGDILKSAGVSTANVAAILAAGSVISQNPDDPTPAQNFANGSINGVSYATIVTNALNAHQAAVQTQDNTQSNKILFNELSQVMQVAATAAGNGINALNSQNPNKTSLAMLAAWLNQTSPRPVSKIENYIIQYGQGGVTEQLIENAIKASGNYYFTNIEPFSHWSGRIANAVSHQTFTTLNTEGANSITSLSAFIGSATFQADGSVLVVSQATTPLSNDLGYNNLYIVDSSGHKIGAVAFGDYNSVSLGSDGVHVGIQGNDYLLFGSDYRSPVYYVTPTQKIEIAPSGANIALTINSDNTETLYATPASGFYPTWQSVDTSIDAGGNVTSVDNQLTSETYISSYNGNFVDTTIFYNAIIHTYDLLNADVSGTPISYDDVAAQLDMDGVSGGVLAAINGGSAGGATPLAPALDLPIAVSSSFTIDGGLGLGGFADPNLTFSDPSQIISDVLNVTTGTYVAMQFESDQVSRGDTGDGDIILVDNDGNVLAVYNAADLASANWTATDVTDGDGTVTQAAGLTLTDNAGDMAVWGIDGTLTSQSGDYVLDDGSFATSPKTYALDTGGSVTGQSNGLNTASLNSSSDIPGAAWSIIATSGPTDASGDVGSSDYVPASSGSITITGETGSGFSGTASLTNVQAVQLADIGYGLQIMDGDTYDFQTDGTLSPYGSASDIIAEVAGTTNNITFDSTVTDYWHVTGDSDTAALESGLTEIYMPDAASAYRYSFINGALTLIGGSTGATRITIPQFGTGTAEITFTDGTTYGFGDLQDDVNFATPSDSFTLDGGDQHDYGYSYISYGYTTNASATFTSGNALPDNSWDIYQDSAGDVVMDGTDAGYDGVAILTNIPTVTLNGGSAYALMETPQNGGALTVANYLNTIVAEADGKTDTVTLSVNQAYWQVNGINDTATLAYGTTEIYLPGDLSDYSVSYNGATGKTILVDSVAGRTGTFTVNNSAYGELNFADGSVIGLDESADDVSFGYTSGLGARTSYATVNLGSYGTLADWTFTQGANSALVSDGTADGYGVTTLYNISQIDLGGLDYSYVGTNPAGGSVTIGTPAAGRAGTIVTDGAGNDALTFSGTGTSYWYVGGGNNTAKLSAGTTDLYLSGPSTQYAETYDMGVMTVTNMATGATEALTLASGAANLDFASGNDIAVMPVSGGAYTVGYGGGTFALVMTPNTGATVTIGTPANGLSGTIVADGTGNDKLNFASVGLSYWEVGGGNNTATLSAGTTDIYFSGGFSQYSEAFNGTNTLAIKNIATGITETLILGAGEGEAVFTSGHSIGLGSGEDDDSFEYGGSGNDTFTVPGLSETINGGAGINTVAFAGTTAPPTGVWTITENTAGQVIVSGVTAGYNATATLTNIEQLTIDGKTYSLLATPNAGGSTTIATPGTGISGTIVADGAGTDALTFSGTGTNYWHVGAGNNTANLTAGTTEIYFTGASSQYTETFNGTNMLVVDNIATGATERLTLSGGAGELVFASGSNIALNKSGDTTIYGGSAAATLTGTTGADTIYAGSGADTLIGAGGVDTYKIGAGTTTETIENGVSSNKTASGNLDFTGSIDAANLWFIHSGNNLVVDVLGTTRQAVLQNWFATGDTYAQTSEIVSADALKLDTSLNNLITAMATFSGSHSGFNPQTTTDTTLTNSTFYGTLSATDKSSWHS